MAKVMRVEISEKRFPEHPAVRAWKELWPHFPVPEGIEVLKFKNPKKSIVYRLRGAGPQQTGVIAKRCLADQARIERLIYEEVLPALGPAAALDYYGFVADADDRYCWLFVEEAEGLAYSGCDEAHRALAGRWLADVQLASLPADVHRRLPSREPADYLQSLRQCRRILCDHLAHNPALPKGLAAVFDRTANSIDALGSEWNSLVKICEAMPRTLVHGDFGDKNLRVREGAFGPKLLVFDWEFAGWGVPAANLAQFVRGGVRPDLNVYWSILREAHPHLTMDDIQGVAICGDLFRVVDELRWTLSVVDFASSDYLLGPIAAVQAYENPLAEALHEIKRVHA